jgi:hypothetical protein
MTHENFCYWLQGYFEIADQSNDIQKDVFNADQLEVVRNHLNLVFYTEQSEREHIEQEEASAMERAREAIEEVERRQADLYESNPHLNPSYPDSRDGRRIKC